jgi:hypothetical protein
VADIKLSTDQLKALLLIGELDKSAYSQLVGDLADPDRPTTRMDLIYRIAALAPQVDGKQVSHLVDALLSLRLLELVQDSSVEQVSGSVLANEAMAAASGNLQERLQQLLESPTIVTMAKAVDVLSEREHIFRDVRILTDIRPLVGPDPSETPKEVVIVNTLKLDFEDGDELRSFYVALDASDLAKMQHAVERAQAKSQSFSRLLGGVGIEHVDLGADDGQ